ncbi:hypothetical protein Tsubulata_040163, partial [Turnera subulata]
RQKNENFLFGTGLSRSQGRADCENPRSLLASVRVCGSQRTKSTRAHDAITTLPQAAPSSLHLSSTYLDPNQAFFSSRFQPRRAQIHVQRSRGALVRQRWRTTCRHVCCTTRVRMTW